MLMHEKNMCKSYSGLCILLHGAISLSEATSYDKIIIIMFCKLNFLNKHNKAKTNQF